MLANSSFQTFFAVINLRSILFSLREIESLTVRTEGPLNVIISSLDLRSFESRNKSARGNEEGGPEGDGWPRWARLFKASWRRASTSTSISAREARMASSRERLELAWRAGECKEVGRALWAASWGVGNWECARFRVAMGSSCGRQSSKSLFGLDQREPPGICDGPETLSASTLAERYAVISSIWVSMAVSVFFSAAWKAACLSATECALNVRVSTFFPLGLWELRSVPPAEEQP